MTLDIILPTLTYLLDEPPYSGYESKVHEATLVHVLSIATSTPIAFRETISKLRDDVKGKLESAVRFSIMATQEQQQKLQQREQQQRAAHEGNKQPTITLKMDFSNFG